MVDNIVLYVIVVEYGAECAEKGGEGEAGESTYYGSLVVGSGVTMRDSHDDACLVVYVPAQLAYKEGEEGGTDEEDCSELTVGTGIVWWYLGTVGVKGGVFGVKVGTVLEVAHLIYVGVVYGGGVLAGT